MSEQDPHDFKDDDEYVKRRRYKSIFDAREMARDSFVEEKEAFNRGDISFESYQSNVRAAVEVYIMEVEQVASNVGADDILSGTTIHTVTIPPPDKLFEYYENDKHRPLSDRPEPKEVKPINGIWGYLTAPEWFTQEWTIQVDVRHEGPKAVTEMNGTQMPIEASVDAFRFVNTFLERVGLELEPKLSDYKADEGPGI